jgi:hypothetical protein
VKRVLCILALVAIAGLVAAREASATPIAAGMAVQVAQHATGFPGHHGYGHGHYGYVPRPYPYPSHPRGPAYIPVGPRPVMVYPPIQPYYGCPGTISIYGRGWGLSVGF